MNTIVIGQFAAKDSFFQQSDRLTFLFESYNGLDYQEFNSYVSNYIEDFKGFVRQKDGS